MIIRQNSPIRLRHCQISISFTSQSGRVEGAAVTNAANAVPFLARNMPARLTLLRSMPPGSAYVPCTVDNVLLPTRRM